MSQCACARECAHVGVVVWELFYRFPFCFSTITTLCAGLVGQVLHDDDDGAHHGEDEGAERNGPEVEGKGAQETPP